MTDEQISQEEQAYDTATMQQLAQEMNYPQIEDKSSIYSIFKEIIRTEDSKKVGNMSEMELYAGRLAFQVALLMKTLDFNIVSNYFEKKSQILFATSLSKNAKLIEALVTQKRQLSSEKKTWEGKKWKEKEHQQ